MGLFFSKVPKYSCIQYFLFFLIFFVFACIELLPPATSVSKLSEMKSNTILKLVSVLCIVILDLTDKNIG